MLKLWIEADTLFDYMGNDDPSPSTAVELVHRFCEYAHHFFENLRNPSSDQVTLYISVDALTKVQENIPLEEHRQDFQNAIQSDIGSIFNVRPKIESTESTEINVEIVSYCEDHISRYLELRQNTELPINDRTKTLLKNSACLLQSDCETVITRTYADDYRNILRNYGASVLSLSEEFNIDTINTIRQARYEWISRFSSSDLPDLTMANEMTYQVMRRFAEDAERQLDADFLAFPPSDLNLGAIVREIDNRLADALQNQSRIFQQKNKDYAQFCHEVRWSDSVHSLSKGELQAQLYGHSLDSLPLGFFPFIFHRNSDREPSQLQEIYREWFAQLNDIFS